MAVFCGSSAAVLKSALVAEIRARAKANPWLRQTIVVSSGASRQDLAADFVRFGAVPGVEIVALWSFAQDVAECQSNTLTNEHPLYALSVLGADPLLEAGAPDSGFSRAFGDLLSAGLDQHRTDALAQALTNVPLTLWPIRDRFIAACQQVLDGAGVRGRDRALAAATAAVRAEPAGSRKDVHLYGFAGATGLATDLLHALVEKGATLWLEVPEGDASRLPIAAARRHVEAFKRKVAGEEGAAQSTEGGPPASPPVLDCFTAPDVAAEAEEVALRVHALVRAGTEPHRIAIVLTESDGAIGPLARALRELGLPFHSRRALAVTPLCRAAKLLARTLRNGASAHPVPDAMSLEGTLLAPASAGGLVTVGACAEWVRTLATTISAPAMVGRDALTAESFDALARHLHGVADELMGAPGGGAFDRVACVRWLALELEAFEESAPADSPSGVQVQSTALARGLCFEHAFLMGAGRGFWPRTKNHGSVFPLAARKAAQAVLPHLGADESSDEVAHLFIQMLHVAPQVTISWSRGGTKERGGAAPWVLSALAMSEKEIEAKSLRANTKARLEAALLKHGALAREGAVVLAGLREDAAQQAELLQSADLEREVALERKALLECFEGRGEWEHRKTLSPWHGRGVALWGPKRVRGAGKSMAPDATSSETPEETVSPTLLEAVAGCGWKRFLERELRLNRSPDPMESKWSVSPMDRGLLVHGALDALVRDALAGQSSLSLTALHEFATEKRIGACVMESLGKLRTGNDTKQRMAWADVELIKERELAEAVSGVNKALELLGLHGVTSVMAAEKSYLVDIDGLRVKFNADLEANQSGRRVFVDWKTGRSEADLGKSPRHFARGTKLQAAIYSQYPPQDGLPTGPGSYAYVSNNFTGTERWQEVSATGAGERFAPTMHTLHEVLKSDIAPPRVGKGLDGDKDGDACRFCELSRVCVFGDSRQRRMLTEQAGRDEILGAWWKLAGSGKEDKSHG